MVSILLIGFLVYNFTEKSAVDKLKHKDLPLLAELISGKIESRITRAEEISVYLSNNPQILSWVADKEKDDQLKAYAMQRIQSLTHDFDYNNSFIVSALTHHYWSEEGRIIDTVSKEDPDDTWFFETLGSGNKVSVNVDYNAERKNTFVFVNALMGEVNQPVGVTGVGLSLSNLSEYMRTMKNDEQNSVWLIDKQGEIDLSDRLEQNGKSIAEILPSDIVKEVMSGTGEQTLVLEYTDRSGSLTDLISRPMKFADMRLVVQSPRKVTVAYLSTIKWNTILAVIVSILSIGFFFLYVSRKLADPYQRSLQLNQHLEGLVADRTKELQDRNEAILDSIQYARRIQVSLLPAEAYFKEAFRDFFVIWKPRDIVGGDFYWIKKTEKGLITAVGDCTGHGVPGALMTMLAIAQLDRIVEQDKTLNPSELLQQLHQSVRKILQQEQGGVSDDGLDLGLCYIEDGRVKFAGAAISLYIKSKEELQVVRGNRRSIGYRRTPQDYEFTQYEWDADDDTVFYLSTDGYFDQNGCEKGYSFGKKRFISLIQEVSGKPLFEQKDLFTDQLIRYMGDEPQRDDVTVLAFRPLQRS